MDEALANEDFLKQFGGSASANLVFVIGFLLYTGLKKLCTRNSKCKTKFHSCCLDVDISDQTLRELPPGAARKDINLGEV